MRIYMTTKGLGLGFAKVEVLRNDIQAKNITFQVGIEVKINNKLT
jgi:hypothetical protein